MKPRYGATALLSILLTSLATPAGAQTLDNSLADLLARIILRDVTLPNPESDPHAVHFSPIEADDLTNPVVGIVQAFNTQLATQFATFPLGTSTGGFTYALDESLGTFTRSSGSFGPAFSERALTIGQGRLSLGFNYQHTRYNDFEGQDLDDGSIKFYLRHEDCCSVDPMRPPGFRVVETPDGTRLTPAFEGDVIEAALALEATTDTFAMVANYGVTEPLGRGHRGTDRQRRAGRDNTGSHRAAVYGPLWAPHLRSRQTQQRRRKPSARAAAPRGSATSCCEPSTTFSETARPTSR